VGEVETLVAQREKRMVGVGGRARKKKGAEERGEDPAHGGGLVGSI